MKFTISKRTLLGAFGKMYEVATKSVKSDFKLAHRVVIEASNKSIVFSATNGHLFAKYTVGDKNCSIKDEGNVIVDASVGYEIIKMIGGSSSETLEHDIEVEKVNDAFRVRDLDAKSRKWSKMQTLASSQPFTIPTPKKGNSYEMLSKDFAPAFKTVAKYQTLWEYDTEFTVIGLHFMEEETRFVCGDGSFFGVWSQKNRKPFKVENEDGDRWIIPAKQAAVIASVVDPDGTSVFTYTDAKTCHIACGDLVLHLKGIPEETYISYDKHAFRYGDNVAVVDVNRQDFLDAINSVKAVRDKEAEKESDFHTCNLQTQDGEMVLSVPSGKYQCEFQFPAQYYKTTEDSFESEYSWLFLNNIATASNKSTIRLYPIDAQGIILAEQLDLSESEKEDRVSVDCPARAASDEFEPQLTFFFACSTEADDEYSDG